MNKGSALFLLLPTLAMAGQNGGVARDNGEISAHVSHSEHIDGIGISGAYRLSVGEFVGASFSGALSSNNGDGGFVDSDDVGAGARLFLRRSDLGSLGVRYAYTHSEYDAPFPVSSGRFHSYSADAEYFFDDLTVFFSRTIQDSNYGDGNTWGLGASYYVTPRSRVSISGWGMDAKDVYSVSLEHQPAFFGDRASVTVSYSKTPGEDSILLGFNYFFDNLVTLKVRDRTLR